LTVKHPAVEDPNGTVDDRWGRFFTTEGVMIRDFVRLQPFGSQECWLLNAFITKSNYLMFDFGSSAIRGQLTRITKISWFPQTSQGKLQN